MFTHVNIGEIQANGAAIMATLAFREQQRRFIANEAGLQVVSTAMSNHDDSTMELATYHELLNEGISLLHIVLSDPVVCTDFMANTDVAVNTSCFT